MNLNDGVFLMLNDYIFGEEIIVDLPAPNFTTVLRFNPLMLNVFGYNVVSADIRDANPLPASTQANWILLCNELGNTSRWTFRNQASPVSNVIKIFSRNVLINRNVWENTYFTETQPINISQLTFSLLNGDGAPIVVSGTTQSIQFVIRFIKKNM